MKIIENISNDVLNKLHEKQQVKIFLDEKY